MKKVVFIFPGQGSQAIGMGRDFFEKNIEISSLFRELLKETNIDFEKLLFEGGDLLEQTEFTQPAILLVSTIAHKIFSEKSNIKPTLLLGHSLGEISALVASGAISIKDGVKLVNRRGELMRNACLNTDAGMMAVVGAITDKVEQVCKDARESNKKVWIANFNNEGQIVLAGLKQDLKSIQEQLKKDADARRTILLNMSVASHCELLQPAVNEFKTLLETLDFQPMNTSIVSNVTTEFYNSKRQTIDLLSQQLIKPVLYRQSIEKLIDNDEVDVFIEFGHGGVLKGINRRITKKIETFVISDMDSLEKVINQF